MSLRSARVLAMTTAFCLVLAACGGQQAAQPTSAPAPTIAAAPTAVPTTAPTDVAAPTAVPTTVSTEAPAAAGVLPRALYLLDGGQIVRLERDGVTRTQVTNEVPFSPEFLAVTQFAVSPLDSTLAYLVQREGSPVLVRSDASGQAPAPLFEQENVGISEPLFTPDGQFVAVHLQNLAEQPEAFQSGVYLIPIAGGAPQLLLADDPPPSEIGSPNFAYTPQAFSPDGTRLLTNRSVQVTELCDLAVVSVPDGTVVPIQPPPAANPDDRSTTCGSGVWTLDGTAIYFIQLRIGADPGNSTIWRALAETGEPVAITPQPAQGPITLYGLLGAADETTVGAFIATASALPVPFEPPAEPLAWSMARVGLADGMATELRPAVSETPFHARWALDGSGVVVLLQPEIGDPGLFWLPADGGEAVLLLGATTNLNSYEWAAE